MYQSHLYSEDIKNIEKDVQILENTSKDITNIY